MEPIIIIFIKLMGAAISGHWDLGDTGTSRDYDALVRSLEWQSHIFASRTCSLPIWLCPLTAKRANNQGENVNTLVYVILLHRLC